MEFKPGLLLIFIFANCMAYERYPYVRPNERLIYNQRYNYQYPRYQSGDNGIPGVAGIDYPIFRKVPWTQFECEQQQHPGYYADPETNCQAFHICQHGGRKDSFLCPNGTLFNQERLVCEWWNTVDCSRAQSFYSINGAVAKAMEEADRRIKVAPEKKLFRDHYQRGYNVKAGPWNKYNWQGEQQGWNEDGTSLRYNQNSHFINKIFYETPGRLVSPSPRSKFFVKSLPTTSSRYSNFYSKPEPNYAIVGDEFNKQTTTNNFAIPANVYLPPPIP
ncbi:U-scoloptoxin(01)-Cw1a [Formica fusca]